MKNYAYRVAVLVMIVSVNLAQAQDWGTMATISSTMGINSNRLCMGEGSRGDIGCPTYAPSLTSAGHVSVTGNLSAAKFIGDGSALTGLATSSPDTITSGTTSVQTTATGLINLTTSGTTTGYFDTVGRLVVPGVSVTTLNGISSTNGYVANMFGVATAPVSVNNASTITPNALVYATGAAGGLQIVRGSSVGVGGAILTLASTRGTAANSYTTLQSGDGIGSLLFGAADGSQYVTGASLVAQVDGTVAASSVPTRLVFSTSSGSGANAPIERMRITSNGYIGISTTTPSAKLDIIDSADQDFMSYGSLNDAAGSNSYDISRLTLGASGSTYPEIYFRVSGSTAVTASVLSNVNLALGTTSSGRNISLGYNGSYASGSPQAVPHVSRMLINNSNGYVGIGTTTPAAKLDVSGSIVSRVVNAGSATTIDFTQGNVAYTSAACGAFTLSGMQDGGMYTLVVQGSGTGPATFTHSGLTARTTATLTCTSAKHTIFSLLRAGSFLYVNMVSGF
jgi:hypothetical protein